MEHIEEKILCFGALNEHEKEDVSSFVKDHPDYAPLFRASLKFYRLLDEARQFIHPEELDEVLLYYVHHKELEKEAPPALQKVYNQIELLMNQEPAIEDRYTVLLEKYQGLNQSSDAEAHFLSLQAEEPTGPTLRAADRSPQVMNRSYVLRKGVGLLVFIFTGLLVFSFYPTPIKEIAYLDPAELEVPGLITVYRNSKVVVDNRPERLLADALITFDRAQVEPFMNLLYYRTSLLQEAEMQLRHAISVYEPHSFLMQEAQYFLAKVLLAQEKTEEGRIILVSIAHSGAARADQANALLEAIDTYASSIRY